MSCNKEALLPLTKSPSSSDIPEDGDLTKTRIILRKPNLESILGGSTGKIPAELISIRKQVFQQHTSPPRVHVRSNSIDSTSAIKILSTVGKKGKTQLTLPNIQPPSPTETDTKEQIVMRRTMSGDSVEASLKKDKENNNSKVSNRSGKTIITICQMEKERASLQQQLSELVRNAESKKAEIASLKMEVNRLKESSSPTIDATVTCLRNEIDSLRQENRGLRERLDEFERSGPIGIQSGIPGEAKKGPHSLPDHMFDASEEAGASGLEKSRSCEWDKTSSTSISEVSVACLQDRISQMEETHYSTNEELQATLQELSDLQDQVNILQMENEQLETEKAVLYESLCSQTEKLEESRNQVYRLKSMLFQENQAKSTPETDKTHNEYLVDLLQSSQVQYDELAAKKDELIASANESRAKMTEIESELEATVENMKTLEGNITKLSEEKRQTETMLNESEKTISGLKIELSVAKTQLEREQAKVVELIKERDAHATSELDVILCEVRQEKDKVAAQAVKLQEQLAMSQLESAKLNDRLKQIEQEAVVLKLDSENALKTMQSKFKNEVSEKERLLKEVQTLETLVRETEVKCHRHLEDKRELKASLNDMQKQLADEKSRAISIEKELQDIRGRFNQKQEEWKAFQDDLLTTVRVANDFKTEAQEHMERILLKNKKMTERIPELEAEIARLKASPSTDSPVVSTCVTDGSMGPPVAVVPPVTPRRSMAVSPVCFTPPVRNAIRSVSLDPVTNSIVKRDIPLPRQSIGKWVDLRSSSKMSVKTLIESLESQAKSACKSPSSTCDPKSPPPSLSSQACASESPAFASPSEGNRLKSPLDTKSHVQTPDKSGQTVTSPIKSPFSSAKKLDSIRLTNMG